MSDSKVEFVNGTVFNSAISCKYETIQRGGEWKNGYLVGTTFYDGMAVVMDASLCIPLVISKDRVRV